MDFDNVILMVISRILLSRSPALTYNIQGVTILLTKMNTNNWLIFWTWYFKFIIFTVQYCHLVILTNTTQKIITKLQITFQMSLSALCSRIFNCCWSLSIFSCVRVVLGLPAPSSFFTERQSGITLYKSFDKPTKLISVRHFSWGNFELDSEGSLWF